MLLKWRLQNGGNIVQASTNQTNTYLMHDDVIKWKHFPRNWPFVREIHRSPVNFPHKGQWRGALMFSLIYAWTNDWVNNREAGDLRRQHGHYDVIVMDRLHFTPRQSALSLWKGQHTNNKTNQRVANLSIDNDANVMFLNIVPWYTIGDNAEIVQMMVGCQTNHYSHVSHSFSENHIYVTVHVEVITHPGLFMHIHTLRMES